MIQLLGTLLIVVAIAFVVSGLIIVCGNALLGGFDDA